MSLEAVPTWVACVTDSGLICSATVPVSKLHVFVFECWFKLLPLFCFSGDLKDRFRVRKRRGDFFQPLFQFAAVWSKTKPSV